jgi:hypothetical protein
MVLFLKAQSPTTDISLMCKMMFNIECNRKIFKLDGTPNTPDVQKEPFNSYTYKQINYEASPSCGVLVVYTPEEATNSSIVGKLADEFRKLNLIDSSSFSPCSLFDNKSTAYTMISKKSSDLIGTSTSLYATHYRKIVTNHNDMARAMTGGSRFIWLVMFGDSYLTPPELTDRYPTEQFLNLALSTVIYDKLSLLNVKHGMMQMNYPSLSQYTIYDKSLIIPEMIRIDETTGLLLEIASYYTDVALETTSVRALTFIKDLPDYFRNFKIDTVEYEDANVRRLDPAKPWHVQLKTPWDYVEQEAQEANILETGKPSFPDDVCFITKVPLYGKVYMIEVSDDSKESGVLAETVDLAYILNPPTSRIFISPYIMHQLIQDPMGKRNINLVEYMKAYKYKIESCNIVKYPRTETQVILNLDTNCISVEKKRLLHTIATYGCMVNFSSYLDSVMYAVNPVTKQIYCGFSRAIRDIEMLAYQKTKTIIFRYGVYNT